MPNTAYSQSEFEARQQQKAEQMQTLLNNSPTYQAAARALLDAQQNLEHLETFVKNQPTLTKRLQYNGNITAAKQAVKDAEAAALQARNEVFRQEHLARLEEQRAGRERVQTEQQQKRAQELEQEMKAEYRAVWQGDQASFDAAWPGLDQRALEARAQANVAAAKHSMGQRYQL